MPVMLPTRGWLTYWDDMLKDGEWADDTFVQALAFFLGLDIFLIPADSATYTQMFHPIWLRQSGITRTTYPPHWLHRRPALPEPPALGGRAKCIWMSDLTSC